MTKLIIIRGYAQAGKSTAIQYLCDRHGLYQFSTSATLGKLSEAIVRVLAGRTIDTKDKSQCVIINGIVHSSRELKITIAEEVLAPILTRKALMMPHYDVIGNGQSVVYECFNEEELNHFLDLYGTFFNDIISVNIRRDSELKGADKRTLDPFAITVDNNGTLEEFKTKLDEIVNI